MANDNVTGDIEEPENHRKLFIGGLSRDTTDEGLTTFYAQWGETADVIVMKDPMTKRSRGFGFVTYKKKASLDESMRNRPHIIDGKTVDPKRAVPREEGQRGESNISSKRLYLSNVREELNEDAIREYFSKFGTVEKVDIVMDKVTNKPRGFGFVTFDDYDPVDACIIQKTHTINGVRCETKKALNKDEMLRAQQNRERLDRFSRSRGMGRDGAPGRGGFMGAQGGYGGAAAGGFQQGYSGYAGYGGAAQGGYAGYGGAAGWGDQSNAAAWAAWGQTGTAAGQQAAAAGTWGQGAAGWQQPAAGGQAWAGQKY